MNLLLEPSNISSDAQIGGKAQGLHWLFKNGFDTPSWSVIPSQTVDNIIGPVKADVLQILSQTKRSNLNESVQRIEKKLETLSVDEDLKEAIYLWIKKENLLNEHFAVRSSFLGEDGDEHSFAGQLITLLDVDTTKIFESIIKCIKGSFSKNILLYKIQNNLDLSSHYMSVIVQKMIFAEKSGVCFSLNPNTHDSNELYISASFGDCEGLVSGTSDCDTYIVNKKTGEIQKNVIKKEFYSNLFEGKSVDQLPDELSEEAVLNPYDLKELSTKTKNIESMKNAPQDIEWAFRDKLYILQVRPVTSKIENEAKKHSMVFDNSNIQESYCGITKPLSFSLASECYRLAYNQLMTFMGFSLKEVEENNFRHSNMLAYVDGRVYYNIHSWYEGLRFMPSFGKSKEDMESMMGVEEPVDFVEGVDLSLKEKIMQIPKMLKIIFRLVSKFSKIDSIVKKFDDGFWKDYRGFSRRLEDKGLSPLDLIRLHEEITASFLRNWAAPLVNDFYVMVYNGKVKKTLKSINELESLSALTSGEDLESLKPTLMIQSLAKTIKDADLSGLFASPTLEDFEAILNSKEVGPDLARFIDLYGDRCIGELKLETVTYRQDPVRLLKLIKNYVDSDYSKQFISDENSKVVIEKVRTKLLEKKGKLSWYLFQSNLKKLRKGIRYRESMRLHRTRVVGLYRKLYSSISVIFFKEGVINDTTDIFYLSHDELVQFICGRGITRDLKSLIDLRKNEFSVFKEKEPKHHFKASFPFSKNYQYFDDNTDNKKDFEGTGCYPGEVQAPVELMLEPDETRPLNGKILCTMRTDPGWAPLFPQISGLLVERGSSLSHSAVVAREMGIPTVVGVSGVTKKIRNGDIINLDGRTGKIKVIEAE